MNPSTGTWSLEEVAGRTCDVYEPARRHALGHVVIYLHGVHESRLVDKADFVAQFDRHGFAVVCPHTGPTWWADRLHEAFDPQLTPERYVRERVVEWIAARFGTRPPGIALVGMSMGGQGGLRMAFKHPNVFPVVAAISPAIDYHLRIDEGDEVLAAMYADRETARQDTATLHVHPLNWPRNIWFSCDPSDHRWHESADRLRMKLSALGIPFECDLETTGGGHGFAYYNRMAEPALAFIASRLDAESRRLL